MKIFSTLLTLLTLIPLYLSYTCQNGNLLDANVRFDDTSISLCLNLTSGNCTVPTFIPSIDHTCDLLYVDILNSTVVVGVDNFIQAGRCVCVDDVNASLVIIIDVNPVIVIEAVFQGQILNFIHSFAYSVINAHSSLSHLNVTYLFVFGDTYFELNVLDILTVELTLAEIFSVTNINLIDIFAYLETYPCNAMNRALDLLSVSTTLTNFRRRLFYWGFSTPNLQNCSVGGRSFLDLDIDVYALRATIDVNLDAIEALLGDFTACNWFDLRLDLSLAVADLLDVRLIIGSVADFLCAIFPTTTTTTTLAPTQTTALSSNVTKPPTPTTTTATTTTATTTATTTTAAPTTTTAAPTTTTAAPTTTTAAPTTTTSAPTHTTSTTSTTPAPTYSSSWWTPTTTTTTTTKWWTPAPTTTTRKPATPRPEWWRA